MGSFQFDHTYDSAGNRTALAIYAGEIHLHFSDRLLLAPAAN